MNMTRHSYEILGKKGEGTFSEVLTCRLPDGSMAAVKRMKQKFKSLEQVNTLREVQALRRLNPHPNIITLIDLNFDPETKTLDLITELMDMNIYERIKSRKHHLPKSLVRSYTYQLLKALDHMHRNGIFHRDVKPENILIKDGLLKLADFGSCRGIYSKPPFTEYISTRWYRPPECLLTSGHYSYKMDVWAVGCVFFEIMCLYPLFPGDNELDQIAKIHAVLGTPTKELLNKIRKVENNDNDYAFPQEPGTGFRKYLPYATSQCISLLTGLLMYDPDERMSARQALKHPFFKDMRDADRKKARKAQQAREAREVQLEKQEPQYQPGQVTAHHAQQLSVPSSSERLKSGTQASPKQPKALQPRRGGAGPSSTTTTTTGSLKHKHHPSGGGASSSSSSSQYHHRTDKIFRSSEKLNTKAKTTRSYPEVRNRQPNSNSRLHAPPSLTKLMHVSQVNRKLNHHQPEAPQGPSFPLTGKAYGLQASTKKKGSVGKGRHNRVGPGGNMATLPAIYSNGSSSTSRTHSHAKGNHHHAGPEKIAPTLGVSQLPQIPPKKI